MQEGHLYHLPLPLKKWPSNKWFLKPPTETLPLKLTMRIKYFFVQLLCNHPTNNLHSFGMVMLAVTISQLFTLVQATNAHSNFLDMLKESA